MKYMVMSILSSVFLIVCLLAIVFFDGGTPAPSSVIGVWTYEQNGRELEIILADNQLTIDQQPLDCTYRLENKLLFVVTEPKTEIQSGQIAPNEITLTFEVHGKDKLELLSVGFKPPEKLFLTRK